MVSGNKLKLALEIILSKDDQSLGMIFLYVNNIKFGYDGHFYDVDSAIQNVIKHFKADDFDTKKLIKCPPLVLFSAFDVCFNEDIDFSGLDSVLIERLNNDEINKYYPNFYQSFIINNNIDNCFFRLGNYIFDTTSLILIPKGERLRLYVRDDLKNIFTDIITMQIDFLNIWKELLELRDPRKLL